MAKLTLLVTSSLIGSATEGGSITLTSMPSSAKKPSFSAAMNGAQLK